MHTKEHVVNQQKVQKSFTKTFTPENERRVLFRFSIEELRDLVQVDSLLLFSYHFVHFERLCFANKKTRGRPFYRGAGGDENLKINFL